LKLENLKELKVEELRLDRCAFRISTALKEDRRFVFLKQ